MLTTHPPPASSGRNPTVDFHGQQRTNDTHASTTDPDARLLRKGKGQPAQCHRRADDPPSRLRHQSTRQKTRGRDIRLDKTIGGGRKLRYIGLERNQFWAELTTATYNLVRMARLEVVPRRRAIQPAA